MQLALAATCWNAGQSDGNAPPYGVYFGGHDSVAMMTSASFQQWAFNVPGSAPQTHVDGGGPSVPCPARADHCALVDQPAGRQEGHCHGHVGGVLVGRRADGLASGPELGAGVVRMRWAQRTRRRRRRAGTLAEGWPAQLSTG